MPRATALHNPFSLSPRFFNSPRQCASSRSTTLQHPKPSPMAPRRWILSINPINVTDSIHDCFHPPSPPSSSGHRLFTNAFIAAVCVAAAAFFFVLTYYTVLVRRHRADNVASNDDLPSEWDDSEADYHVRRIRTVGLDESTINSISVNPYITGGGRTADCSVCLGEFRDSELVRLLPACGHAFHIPCIDTWLRDHISCPLCRAHIIVPADSCSGDWPPCVQTGMP